METLTVKLKNRFKEAKKELTKYIDWIKEYWDWAEDKLSIEEILPLIIDMDDENGVRELARICKLDWYILPFRKDFDCKWLEKYADIINWNHILCTVCDNDSKKLGGPVHEIINAILKNLDRIDEEYWDVVCENIPLPANLVIKYIDKITESIFNNPNYEKYPDSLKLLLEQKFGKI